MAWELRAACPTGSISLGSSGHLLVHLCAPCIAGGSSALSEQLLGSIYVFPKANTAGDSYRVANLCECPSKATININGKSNTIHESHSGVTGSICSPWHLPIQHLNTELTFPTAPGARSAQQDE